MKQIGVINGSGEWTALTKYLHRRRENIITLEKFDKMFEQYQDGKFEHTLDRLLQSGRVKVNGLNPVLQLSQADSLFTQNYWKRAIHEIRREYILGKGWMIQANRYLADLKVFIG